MSDRKTTLKTKSHQGAVRVEQPFQMTVSRGCIGYYRSFAKAGRSSSDYDNDRDEGNDSIGCRPGGLEEIAQGRGRCPQCAVLVRWQISFSFCNSSTAHSQTVGH